MTTEKTISAIKNHCPPILSEGIFEDCAFDTIIGQYISNPAQYLTCDTKSIIERNKIIKLLIENTELYKALSSLRETLDELENIPIDKDSDPVHVIGGLQIFLEIYRKLGEAREALRGTIAASQEGLADSTIFLYIENDIQHVLDKFFSDNFEEVFSKIVTDQPGAIGFLAIFDDEARLSHLSLASAYHQRFKKPPFWKEDMEHKYIGETIMLPATPGFSITKGPSSGDHFPYWYGVYINTFLRAHASAGARQAALYAKAISSALKSTQAYMSFFLGAADFARSLPIYTFAEVREMDAAAFNAHQLYHPLYSRHVTRNSLRLTRDSSVALVGGINKGGKTTFLRSVAIAQVLFQMGLPVPAHEASLSPASSIVCAFNRDENAGYGYGKLGQELLQLKDSLSILDENGFFLFNEPLTASTPSECSLLSLEALCVVKALGARGIMITHFHELHGYIKEINQKLPGGQVFSLRTVVESDDLPEFSIVHGAPVGGSGARGFLRD